MKLDPSVLKEISKTVDGVVKKNKMAIDNARDIDKLLKRIDKLESKLASAELDIKIASHKIEANASALKAITNQKLDKEMKAVQAKLSKLSKSG